MKLFIVSMPFLEQCPSILSWLTKLGSLSYSFLLDHRVFFDFIESAISLLYPAMYMVNSIYSLNVCVSSLDKPSQTPEARDVFFYFLQCLMLWKIPNYSAVYIGIKHSLQLGKYACCMHAINQKLRAWVSAFMWFYHVHLSANLFISYLFHLNQILT